jgi:biotin transport system permease protein
MLALTFPRRTWAHRIAAGWKLAALALVSAVMFLIDNPMIQALALLSVVALHAATGRDILRYAMWMMKPIVIFAVIIAGWHLLTWDIAAGATIVLRMVLLVGLANFVTMTSELDDMIGVVEWLLRPLRLLGFNTHAAGLAFAMVIRFTPALVQKGATLIESWRARSAKRPGWRVAIPICLLAIDDADHVSEALRARGGLSPQGKQ